MFGIGRFWTFCCVLIVSRAGVYSFVETLSVGAASEPAGGASSSAASAASSSAGSASSGASAPLAPASPGSSSAALAASAHFEPQVAMLCDVGGKAAYHNQYMTEGGRWVADTDTKGNGCMKDKMEILEYCKKVYQKRDITNIVESSHYLKVQNWCRIGQRKKCKGEPRWVKPFRCLEGPFQSDALLVPESCMFDHIHNQTRCWEFDRWNATAARTCRDRGLLLRSFAMLLPCGISLFSGVEFVCCPKHFKDNMKPHKPLDFSALAGHVDDEKLEEVLDAGKVSEAVGGSTTGASSQPNAQAEGTGLDTEDADDDDEDEDEGEEEEEEGGEDEDEDEEDEDDSEDDYAAADDDKKSSNASGRRRGSLSDAQAASKAQTTTPPTTAKPTVSQATTNTAAPALSPAASSGDSALPQPTPDPYFTHFDPRVEHQAFKEAQQRLEEMHREKVTKVMKDWSDLEERYQDMRSSDPKAADEFKRRMTSRFQKTVQALEEEGEAEKHQLVAMHQQRVMAHINERKKEAMTCYTEALNDNPPNTHRVQKCLQKLLRSLHKDRHHTIAHYRHLLASSFDQAEREKGITLEHLADIDRMVNQSLQMLERFPDLATKIHSLMEDYIQALRSKDETPGSLLTMTRDAEAAILDKYRTEYVAKQEEKERQRQLEKERKEQRKRERLELREEKRRVEAALGKKLGRGQFDPETMEDEAAGIGSDAENMVSGASVAPSASPSPSAHRAGLGRQADTADEGMGEEEEEGGDEEEEDEEDDGEDEVEEESSPEEDGPVRPHRLETVRVAHVQSHDVSHGEPTYSVRREVYHKESKSVYFTLAFAGIALMAAVVVGFAVLRRRNARSPHNQGFVEVDQAATPEERHVANMQINGYENPTYKYFEAKE